MTGTGVATRVAFWNTTSSLTSDADLYWDNTSKRLGIGTSGPSFDLDVAGSIYGTAVYVGNSIQNYLFSYGSNMHIYSQAGTTITLGGGIGNRQNNVAATNGFTQLSRGGTAHGTLGINTSPVNFTTIAVGTNAPDVIISGINSSEPGGLLLHNPDTTISAGQDLGILMFGGRDDSSNSYVSSEIIGTVVQAPGVGAGGGGILKLRTATVSTGAVPITRVFIDNNGKVGIGTGDVTPLAKLDVNGDSYFRSDFAVAKTGAIGTSSGIEFLAGGASSGGGQIKIGDVDGYWGGGNSYSVWDTDNETLTHGVNVGINRDPTEMLHIWKGSLFLDSAGIRDANGDYGAAGQNLKSKGQNVAEWSWEKQTLVSTFYASSQQSGTVIYMPVGGTLSETSSNQYYNNFVAPYDGRVRQIRIKNITGTPTATGLTSFRVYVNGSNVSSLSPTVTNGGSNGMMGVKLFDDGDATFSAGDRVQFAYVASGSTGYMYGSSATFIIEYTQNK